MRLLLLEHDWSFLRYSYYWPLIPYKGIVEAENIDWDANMVLGSINPKQKPALLAPSTSDRF